MTLLPQAARRPSTRRRKVALLIETSNAYARGILEGIAEYQRSRDQWSIYLPELERGAPPPQWLESWHGDGIIARIETEAIATFVQRLRLPTIDVSAARRIASIPWVETDDSKVADLAYDHLRERGFQQFAYCGPKDFNWSVWRGKRFLERCQQDHLPAFQFWTDILTRSERNPQAQVASKSKRNLDSWLLELPKPIGLFCALDIQAQIVLDHCRNLEILVPDQIAVIGVDNDPIVCNLAHPSITSVIPDAKGAGYRAAELLDRWMAQSSSQASDSVSELHAPTGRQTDVMTERQADRDPADSKAILLEPIGIESRQSTDVSAVTSPEIAMAIRFIRDHACEGIDVSHLLKEIPLSRRQLEYKFLELTGITPHELITRVRMERVKSLLRSTDLALEEIASRCGFEHPEYMSVVFKKRFSITPAKFRRNQT